MMVVYNEAARFLARVLADLEQWVDQIVVLDDASTDGTGDICRACRRVVLYERNRENMFSTHEARLREKLWRMVETVRPDWILAIDADEIFEPRMRHEARSLVEQDYYDAVEFRMFDLWGSEEYYRCDGQWNPWSRFSRLLVRYRPGRGYTWPDLPVHCGRWPLELRGGLPVYYSDIRVKHLGWVRSEDHLAKYLFYRERDIRMYGRPSEHTESVMAPPSRVQLERWREGKVLPL